MPLFKMIILFAHLNQLKITIFTKLNMLNKSKRLGKNVNQSSKNFHMRSNQELKLSSMNFHNLNMREYLRFALNTTLFWRDWKYQDSLSKQTLNSKKKI